MTERSYLSIREVLDLLVAEFPDVTISKIRFLESRGLIHPERTPSGYRKFYDDDVARLRWILGQQRENFLPLKVIKRRLEASSGGEIAPGIVEASLFEEECPEPPGAPSELVAVGAPSERAAGEAPGTGGLRLVVRGGAAAPPAAPDAGGEHPRSVGGTDERGSFAAMAVRRDGGREEHPGRGGREPQRPAAPAGTPQRPAAAPAGASRPAQVRAGAPGAGPAAAGPPPGPAGPAAAGPPPGPAESPPPGAPAAPAAAPGSMAGSLASGASLTAEELAAASGVEVAVVAELEEYGLVTGRTIAGVRCYDEDALVVARLAAGFRAFGIESRHLRAFKSAAERQAGLFAQVVTPYLRQRNPAARERAHESLGELASLGASLQAALLRAELRDLTGG